MSEPRSVDRLATVEVVTGRALSASEEAALRAYAAEHDRSLAWVIRKALREFIYREKSKKQKKRAAGPR